MSIQVDLHLVVSGSITVSDGHNIAGAVKRQLLCDIPDVVDVLIHIEPDEAADMENVRRRWKIPEKREFRTEGTKRFLPLSGMI